MKKILVVATLAVLLVGMCGCSVSWVREHMPSSIEDIESDPTLNNVASSLLYDSGFADAVENAKSELEDLAGSSESE